MKDYTNDLTDDNQTTPQSEPLDDDQVQNRSGAYTWESDKWRRLRRFLVIGTEGGTFYASGQDLTQENYKSLQKCVEEDAKKAVEYIVNVSDSGEAVKNDPAIFALAYVLKCADNKEDRKYAAKSVSDVCRIGTHMYQLADYIEHFGGWGRLTRQVFSNWYKEKDPGYLSYQLVKYRQRHGWEHRDIMRKAHPEPKGEVEDNLFDYAVNGWDKEQISDDPPEEEYLQQVWAFERAKYLPNNSEGRKELVRLISEYDLPRECVPNEFLNDREVWDALLHGGEYGMPMWAMLRNLGKMTSVGLLDSMSDATQTVCDALTNQDKVEGSRMHPLSVLQAHKVYGQGGGVKGSLTWTPAQPIIDALNETFELSFENVEPTGKRVMHCFDVSGSMYGGYGFGSGKISGLHLTPLEVEAAIGKIALETESRYHTMAFSDRFQELNIDGRSTLSSIQDKMKRMSYGSTNCSLPMQYAEQKNMDVDAFVIHTDHETNTGDVHPSKALENYRQSQGIEDAKLVTVAMTANRFTIADPKDPNQLDVCGCSTNTPKMINMFIRGEF